MSEPAPTDKTSQDLIVRRDKAQEEARKAQAALVAICAAVGHEMHDDGHDSHYDWSCCARCGMTEKS